jgi:recombination protein RecA
MPVDTKNLAKALDAIRKEYGDDSIRTGDDDEELIRIPTGIIQLDKLVGGGMPMGRWEHWYGGFGSGKSLTAFHLIAQAQKLGYTCAYYDVEKQYNKGWVEGIGVDVKNLHVVEGNEIEPLGEKMDVLLPAINIHVIDSVGAGVSLEQQAARLDESRMATAPRAWAKVIPRIQSRFDRKNNMVILINQTREVFGKPGQEKPTGGALLEYISSLSLHFSKSSWLFRDKNNNLSETGTKTDAETGRVKPDGIDLVVQIKKSRVSDPYGSARMRFEFGSGGKFDEMWALSGYAIFAEIIGKAGSWYTLPNGERVQGESKVRDYIRENPEFANELREVYYSG